MVSQQIITGNHMHACTMDRSRGVCDPLGYTQFGGVPPGAPKAKDYWQGHPFLACHPRMGDPVPASGAGLCRRPGVPSTPLRSRAQGADDSTPESARRPPAPQRLSPHLVIFRSPGASPTALRRQLGKQTQRQIVPRLIPGKDAKSHPATPNTPSPPPPPGPPPRRGASAGWVPGNAGAYSCLLEMGGGQEPRDAAFSSYLYRTGEAQERTLGEDGAQEGQTTNQQGAPERPRCKKAQSLPMKWGGGGRPGKRPETQRCRV